MSISKIIISLICALSIIGCTTQNETSFSDEQIIISSDLENFYNAIDSIAMESDTSNYLSILNSAFINKASVGQKRMIQERRYTSDGYKNSILNRPKFWNSLRSNVNTVDRFSEEIKIGIDKLHMIYPNLKHSTIFYTIGNHRSPGTGVDSLVLIGSEFALGDSSTIVEELPSYNQDYYKINPINYLQFLSVHEYVHTQQKPMVHNLLSLTLYEGIAEFVAIKATGQNSPWKAFVYGPENKKKIFDKFESDMFKPSSLYNWLWNSPNNEFGTSDLGYFVGHQIASRYYESETDKKLAIKKLIELDYSDEKEIEELVNSTKIFSTSLDLIEKEYENSRPIVKKIKQFVNNSQNVDPNIKEITLEFSEPLNGHNTGLDFGDLGEGAFPKNDINGRYWSEDGSMWTISVELEPNTKYQLLISSNFRTKNNVHLKPYLVEFKTK